MSDGIHRADTSLAAGKAVPTASRWRLYRLALAAMATMALLATPLGGLHDSLWHHLAEGRGLLAGDLAATSASWLFSVLLHLSWMAFSFTGLALLRGALYATLLAAGAHYLARHGRAADAGWLAGTFGFFAVLALQHAFDFGPQIASAALLLFCLVLLEGRGRWAWALPLVALLWMNLDGRQFPILLLIAGAYTFEALLARRQGLADAANQRWLVILMLSMAMVFVTPQGARIVDLPADPSGAAAPAWRQLATFQFSSDGLGPATPRNLLLACGVLALIAGVATRRLRASHAVLAIGAFWLAASAQPSPMAAILLLPLIVAQGAPWPIAWSSPWTRRDVAAAGAAAFVLLTPLVHIARHWPGTSHDWPLGGVNLPEGAVAFLEQHSALALPQLHPPAADGYWRWARPSPAAPSAHDEREAFARTSAFVDGDALARYLIRHSPDIIAAPLDARAFPALISRHPRYRPVFFDDTVLLYADRDRHFALVADYELTEAHPTKEVEPAAMTPERRARLRAELERLESVDPRNLRVGEALAELDAFDGAPDRALERLRRVLDIDPRRARARSAQGDVLRAQGDLEGAIRSYRQAATDCAEGPESSIVFRRLADALTTKGDAEGAFDALEAAVGRFNIVAPAADLHRLGELAAAAGRPALARKFLAFAEFKLAPGEVELRGRIEATRARLPPEGRR